MKKSYLRQIIKEEIKANLKEFNIHDIPGRDPGYLSGVSGRQPEDVNPKQVESNRQKRAYQIANDIIKNQMDFPEDSIEDEKLFLAAIKALTDKLYEKAADMFSSAGSAPDEY